ncbi:MAG TPA: ABC transporter ATP-binding protein [Candidatus Onthousia excrementipullorum]|uniref:ABC transporter ATP-binding protein n=1 Tax=Candidatus Onthousia excrementipullorum TaxID=2840884 RepID=A0A9D1DUA9_9FIRM|nr:ABC transporter ATP-binding protein [Candidatus Onthousia excrementipullorum]
MALLEVSHITKSYGNNKVLDDVTFSIPKGKIVGLLGPNGSGKTTLIKLINDLLKEDSGTIKVNGLDLGVETKKIISYLPDKNYLNNNMTVLELLNYFKDFYEDFRIDKAKELIGKLDLDLNQKLKTMSKGTKEKVQLILVMSRKAKLYILDEPIGGIDPAARDYIINTILTNFSDDASLLISTHLISDLEKVLDEIIFLKNGKVVRSGSTDEIRKETKLSINDLFREEFKC